MSAGHLLKTNAQILSCIGASVTMVQGNTAASVGTDPSIVIGLVMKLVLGFLCRCLFLFLLGQKFWALLPRIRTTSLWEVGLSISLD